MKTNHKGFSIGVILIVFVIAGLTIGTGMYVWKTKENTSKNKAETNATAENKDENKFMVIKEWGIKVPNDNNVGSLSYNLHDNYAEIRSSELDKLSGSCRSNSVIVYRGNKAEIVPSEVGSNTYLDVYNQTTVLDYNFSTRSIKAKAGDYIFVAPGDSGVECSPNPTPYDTNAKTLRQDETTAMLNIVRDINLLVQE